MKNYLVSIMFTISILFTTTAFSTEIDTKDIYQCIVYDHCQDFEKNFIYSEEPPFKEKNIKLVKIKIAEVYFSSPIFYKKYNSSHDLYFDKVVKMFPNIGVQILDYNREKSFIFGKTKPVVMRRFFKLEWKEIYMLIFHIEKDASNTHTNVYLLVEPMKKRPLSSYYTSDNPNLESNNIRKIIANELEKLM